MKAGDEIPMILVACEEFQTVTMAEQWGQWIESGNMTERQLRLFK